jgi:large repetitive protein
MPSSGGTWTEKVLVRFDGKPNDTPINDLVMDGIGNLYGTAAGYDTDSLGSIYEVIRTGSVVTFIGDSGIVGATAKIVGQGFEGATAVSFNGTAASFTVKSDTYMTATIPAGATTGQVTVTEPGGTLTSNENFNVLPTTRDFVPNNGPAGTVVTIYGMSLTQTTAVSFDGVAATGFSVVSDTELQATVPEGANTGFIKITTAGGSFTTCNKFYVTP